MNVNATRPHRAGSTRLVFLVILVIFILSWIGTLIFGYVIYGNVRATAARTDNALRSLTWAALAYACEHEGRFPTSELELFSMEPLPERIDCRPSLAGTWPSTRTEALLGNPPPEELAFASRKLKLYFSSDGALPPVFDANGMPTELGTIPLLKEWLSSFSEARPAQPGP